jgi:uncharacterized protein (DUF2062 family)
MLILHLLSQLSSARPGHEDWNKMPKPDDIENKKQKSPPLKERLRLFLIRIRDLQGEPRYVATGMAIGVFVAVTPTIPFHTVIALALAFILKGSKPAAVIGVWFSNPLTIPALYYGSFKIGTLLLGEPPPYDIHFESIPDLLELGLDVTLAMLIGGVLLGIIPAVIAYFVTFRVVVKLRERPRRKEQLAGGQRTEVGGQKPEDRGQKIRR